MKPKEILKMLVDGYTQRLQEAEIREAEFNVCHMRIDALGKALSCVTLALAKDTGLNDNVRRSFDSLTQTLADGQTLTDKHLRKIRNTNWFFRDQTMAEMKRIGQMIDQLPDE